MSGVHTQLTSELDALWRFALRLTSNEADAQDLVQRTCVKALENEHQYKETGKLRSWLFRIEHRIWLNVLRSRQIRSAGSFNPGYVQPSSTGSASTPGLSTSAHQSAPESIREDTREQAEFNDEHTPESQMRLHQIFVQVESLPEAHRLVVVLVCVEGFTYKEAAQILEIPVGTVMSRLARARITLGKIMLSGEYDKNPAGVDRGAKQ